MTAGDAVGHESMLLVALSRVYVGVRHPMDTVVGLLAGACVTLAVVRLAGRSVTRLVNRLTDTGGGRWWPRYQPSAGKFGHLRLTASCDPVPKSS